MSRARSLKGDGSMSYWINIVLQFFIFGFAGWCMEVILKYRQYHRFINRGFLTGPILPIYGFGVVLITVVVGNLGCLTASKQARQRKRRVERYFFVNIRIYSYTLCHGML